MHRDSGTANRKPDSLENKFASYVTKNKVFMSTPKGDRFVNKLLLFVDADECDSDQCLNGATCNDAVNSYTCDCVAGYTGQYCEIGRCYI